MRHSPIAIAVFLATALSASLLAQHTAHTGLGHHSRPSPHETVESDVDGCHIAITYGRPSKTDRVIWGKLVPWEKVWMPGADEATTIVTSKTIAFGPLVLPAGMHTLYMLPGIKESKLIISKMNFQDHTFYYPQADLGRVPLALGKVSPMVEQMTIAAKPRAGGGVLTLTWDTREYSANFVVK
jgi:hypothetical protein